MMSKKVKQFIFAGLAVLAMGAVLAGCGDTNSGQATTANGKKIIHVGTNPTFIPFEFTDDQSKSLAGFDIDLIQAVAKHMNAEVEFKNVAFDSLIPSLGNKDIDLAASGMTITKARAEKVLFSEPYYESAMGVVVKADSSIKDLKDLEGKNISVQIGTTGADLAAQIAGATLKQFDHSSEALLELSNGAVDASVLDLPVAQYYATKHPDANIKVIPYPNTKKYFGFAVAKDNKELQTEVNKALEEMKKNGELNAIYQKWFKTDAPADMPIEWPGT